MVLSGIFRQIRFLAKLEQVPPTEPRVADPACKAVGREEPWVGLLLGLPNRLGLPM